MAGLGRDTGGLKCADTQGLRKRPTLRTRVHIPTQRLRLAGFSDNSRVLSSQTSSIDSGDKAYG